ncbi:MAG: hypothetical protein BMS9Abin29_0784 [Gemmatimonadota bacterium]|nr:MAG: hypothetical protein BMS9Abin29_0784 [Gemmatimonadota bacterium]
MKANRKLRGSGFKHTLPSVWPFFAPWVIMVVLTAPVITVAMMLAGLVPPASRTDVWFFLLTRVPLLAVAASGLAVFMTARVAGPMVQLRRAFDDVKGGDLNRRLRFRRADKHLREIETAFDEMMVALRERADSTGGLETE